MNEMTRLNVVALGGASPFPFVGFVASAIAGGVIRKARKGSFWWGCFFGWFLPGVGCLLAAFLKPFAPPPDSPLAAAPGRKLGRVVLGLLNLSISIWFAVFVFQGMRVLGWVFLVRSPNLLLGGVYWLALPVIFAAAGVVLLRYRYQSGRHRPLTLLACTVAAIVAVFAVGSFLSDGMPVREGLEAGLLILDCVGLFVYG